MTTIQAYDIADDDTGTAETVAHMARIIREGMACPMVQEATTAICRAADPRDEEATALALRAWLADHVEFMRDPDGIELIHTPEWQLRRILDDGITRVDCDCAAVLGGALAGCAGFHVSLVTVAFLDKSNDPTVYSPYSHVWCSISRQGRRWVELDVTRPMQSIPLSRIVRQCVTRVC